MPSSPRWPPIFKSWRKRLLILGVWILIAGAAGPHPPPKAQAAELDETQEEVFLALEEGLRIVLPDSEEIVSEERTLTQEERRRIENYSGRPVLEPVVTIYIGKKEGKIVGYAFVTEEIGMYKPITSIVGVTPEGRIREVAVMVYRESRGGDVRRRRFLNQYRGKRLSDPLEINRDIINVTGATLSVRSVNSQVKKALAVANELFLQTGR